MESKSSRKKSSKKSDGYHGIRSLNHNGWVVKQFQGGTKEQISKIAE
jgi:hypothetical protein